MQWFALYVFVCGLQIDCASIIIVNSMKLYRLPHQREQ